MKRLCLMIWVIGLLLSWFGTNVVLYASDPYIHLSERAFIPGIGIAGQRAILGIALGPDETKLYAACWADAPSPVAVYSTLDYSLLDSMSYGRCHGGVAVSLDGRYVFTPSYYEGTCSRFDLLDGKRRTDLPAGSWPVGIGVSPDGRKLVVLSGSDGRSYDMNNDAVYLYDISGDNFSTLTAVALDDEVEGARPIFSEDSKFVYVPTYTRKSSRARLYEVSLTPPYKVTRYLEPPASTNRLASVTSNGNTLYLSDTDNSRVWIVDLQSWRIIDYIDLSFAPGAVSMHPDGQHLFVVPWYYPVVGNYISVFDVDTKGLAGHVVLTHYTPQYIVFTQDGQTAYVGHYHVDGGITVLDIAKGENDPPIADAGDDIIADANETVTLDGSGSSDPDGQIIKYTWKRLPDGVIIYSGSDPACQPRALGRVEELIELTVTDNSMATATDTLKIISRTTQELKDQLAAMQFQIDQVQRQNQELQALVDRISSFPPIAQWLRRAVKFGDLNGDGQINMADFALLTKGWLR